MAGRWKPSDWQEENRTAGFHALAVGLGLVGGAFLTQVLVVGCILVVVAVGLEWWLKHRAAKRQQEFEEKQRAIEEQDSQIQAQLYELGIVRAQNEILAQLTDTEAFLREHTAFGEPRNRYSGVRANIALLDAAYTGHNGGEQAMGLAYKGSGYDVTALHRRYRQHVLAIGKAWVEKTIPVCWPPEEQWPKDDHPSQQPDYEAEPFDRTAALDGWNPPPGFVVEGSRTWFVASQALLNDQSEAVAVLSIDTNSWDTRVWRHILSQLPYFVTNYQRMLRHTLQADGNYRWPGSSEEFE